MADTREEAMIAIVPEPREIAPQPGQFVLRADTAIVFDGASRASAEWLAAKLSTATGYALSPRAGAAGGTNAIALDVAPSPGLGAEGYELTAAPAGVRIRGGGPAGVFYACQTLRQLLPPQIESPAPVTNVVWALPGVRIADRPRFGWRGCLVDEARNFLGKDVIKRQIDLLALHKFNRLHWHLTDDQGWRIAIPKYPRLTAVGAWRGEPRTGGCYTPEDIREIVRYAESRHVLIVPEIEMPGHAQAALAAYPQLGCRGKGYAVGTDWGIYDDVYCAGSDDVVPFLEDVLTEVMSLFPGPYIHVGGDEVPKDRWRNCPKCQARLKAQGLKDEHELQSWFVKRFDAFLRQRGRRMIGWDEIMDGGLAEGAVVQAWRGMDWAVKAANLDHDVIVSPTSNCYFDYGLDAISVMKVYSFEPIASEVKPDKTHHILGIEGNLWGEHIPNADRLDFQGFPRLCALAEVGWSPAAARSGDAFAARMRVHLDRLDRLGVRYNREAKIGSWGTCVGHWAPEQVAAAYASVDWDVTERVLNPGAYELTLLYKAGMFGIDIEWVALIENGIEVARDAHKGFSGYNKDNITYRLDLRGVKPQATYVLRASLKGNGGTDSAGDVLMLSPGRPDAAGRE